MNKKGFSSIALLIILVIIAAGVTGYFVIRQKAAAADSSDNNVSQNSPVNISQLTKEQVLNGFDLCGQQFKNGEIDNGWEKYTQLEKTCSQAQAGISLYADSMVFADLDNDGVMEVLVPARVVRASSGGALYVFKNDSGTARVIDTIGFGKQNRKVISVDGSTVVVEAEAGMGYPSYQEIYKFVNGKLVKQ